MDANRHKRDIELKRYHSIDIPADASEEHRRYAYVAAVNLGKRRLARVVWPWQTRPVVSYVQRGRQ